MKSCTCDTRFSRYLSIYLVGHRRGCPMYQPRLRPLREKPLVAARPTFVGKRRDRRRPARPR